MQLALLGTTPVSDRRQFSLAKLFLLVAALGIVFSIASHSPVIAAALGATSIAAFLESIGAGGLMLNSFVAFLAMAASCLWAAAVSALMASDNNHGGSLIAAGLAVCGVGATMKYFGGFRNRELFGGILSCEIAIVGFVSATVDARMFWSGMGAGIFYSIPTVVVPTLVATIVPNKRARVDPNNVLR